MNKILLFEKKIFHTKRASSNIKNNFHFEYIDLEFLIKNYLFKNDTISHIGIPEFAKIDNQFIQNVINDNIHTTVVALNLECLSSDSNIHNEYLYSLFKLANDNPTILFILFYHELNISSYTNIPDNVFCVLNSFNIDYNITRKITTYYDLNWKLQCNSKNFYDLNRIFFNFRRYKKYSFYNGIHKPIRLFAYNVIKDNNMLGDGYFSYLDYASHINEKEVISDVMRLFGIKKIEDYYEFIKKFEIPYLLDIFKTPLNDIHPNWGSVPPFMNPLIYSLNSYINITAETCSHIEENYVSISEKTYKPFISFNIPLIIGQPSIYSYLRNCGFDMFDDFFDNSNCTNEADMLNQIKFNFDIINRIKIKDLHEFYIKNFNRIEKNFEILSSTSRDNIKHHIHSKLKELQSI